MTNQLFAFPDEGSWSFDEVTFSEPHRGPALEADPTPAFLIASLGTTLSKALKRKGVRIAREQAENQPQDYRAIVQFGVSPELFDLFFNARRGYRGHFRANWHCGLQFNGELITVLRGILDSELPDTKLGRQLNARFEDVGPVRIEKSFLMASLVSDLSKIWFCTKRIREDGGIEPLPSGLIGPRILLASGGTWAAPYREADTSWLDVKGAFLGMGGPYQPKSPTQRAKKLQETGEA